MKHLVTALIIITIAGFALALLGAGRAGPDITGAWCNDSGDAWEFFDEGTTMLDHLDSGASVGDYRFVDDTRIRVDWGAGWGPTIYTVQRTGKRLTVTDLDGTATAWAVCSADHQARREELRRNRQACGVTALEYQPGDTFDITCPASCPASSVWGDGIYTADSGICTAARHAGALGEGQGGTVRVYTLDGLVSYDGATRHGVTTNPWGSYDRSYTFDPRLTDVRQITNGR